MAEIAEHADILLDVLVLAFIEFEILYVCRWECVLLHMKNILNPEPGPWNAVVYVYACVRLPAVVCV